MEVVEVVRRNARELRDDSVNKQPNLSLDKARDCDLRGLAIRFAFGFCVSVVVGIITEVAGDRVGGLFLAFPAILPASLTLIADQEGERKARVDAGGAIIGGVALAFFGLVSWLLLGKIPVLWAEVVALIVWTAAAIGMYFAVRALMRR
jgi:hypothetical protein